jgi:uncharacterized membrane protein
MDDIALARVLHVLAVVIWIGGICMATTVALPAARRGDLGADPLRAFKAIERRFVWQARIAVIVVALSGLYMIDRLDLWRRFQSITYWWMHAMVCLWLLFAFILFVAEPLVLRRHFHARAVKHPDVALARLQRLHWVLLGLSVVTIMGAVAGSHGWSMF